MGITNSNKELSTARIDCGGSFQVKLSLTAAPDIVSNPTDIVLILDRSGSMAGSALANLKNGAKAFIDIIDEATDGTQDGQIGSGSRIAVVSFAITATQDTQLITSVADLKAAVDALTAGGSTNHADAFTKASELLAAPSTNARVMVMFTDGETTVGPDPSPIAAAARAAGVIIYAIGLSGRGGVDVSALEASVGKLCAARRIDFYGLGASGLVALDASNKFQRCDKLTIAHMDTHNQLLSALTLRPEDVAVLISYSGDTTDMLSLARQIREQGATIISLTRYGKNPLSEMADIRLYSSSTETLLRSGAMSSRIAQLAVIDTLYAAMCSRAFDEVKPHLEKSRMATMRLHQSGEKEK